MTNDLTFALSLSSTLEADLEKTLTPLIQKTLGTAWAQIPHPFPLKTIPTPKKQPFSVSLRLSDDSELQSLNKTYRGKDRPTNVLSFPLFDDIINFPDLCENKHTEAVELGDIIFSWQKVHQEAQEQQKTALSHFQHLLLHGLLHLLGYDHNTQAQAQMMENLEIDILSRLSITNPYSFFSIDVLDS